MARIVKLPGQERKASREARLKKKRKYKMRPWDDDKVDASMAQEYTLLAGSSSRYWKPFVDDQERVYPVKVYDAQGQLTKTWTKKQLMARVEQKYHWNNHPMV